MEGTRLDEFIQRFELATIEIGHAIGRLAHVASGCDTTGPQQHLMRTLVRAGGMRSSELADSLHIQPSAVTATVDRLVARGLVTRESDESDRRVVRVVPTAEGVAESRRVEETVRGYLRELLTALDDDELEGLVASFEKMSAAAARAAEPRGAAAGEHAPVRNV